MLTMELIKYKHRFSLKKQCSQRIKWHNTLQSQKWNVQLNTFHRASN